MPARRAIQDKLICTLFACLQSLEQRLQPVLDSQPQDPEANPVPPQPPTVAGMLEVQNGRLEQLAQDINKLRDRLQV